MVGAGCLFILVLAAAWWFNRRDTLERKRWMLWVLLLCMPLGLPGFPGRLDRRRSGPPAWAIQDLMPVGVAASRIASGSVATTFFIFLVLFAALLVAEISILCKQIKIGPEKE